jgi:hypothetical protein
MFLLPLSKSSSSRYWLSRLFRPINDRGEASPHYMSLEEADKASNDEVLQGISTWHQAGGGDGFESRRWLG